MQVTYIYSTHIYTDIYNHILIFIEHMTSISKNVYIDKLNE